MDQYDAATGAAIAGGTLTFTVPGISAPSALAISGNSLYVQNFGATNAINKYDATTGAPIAGWTPISGPQVGRGNMAISGNNLYTVKGAGTVGKYDATTGAAIPGWTFSNMLSIESVAISGNHLYATDSFTHTVGEYDATTGAAIAGWSPPSGFSNTMALAISGVPEPASIGLLGMGAILLSTRRRRMNACM